LVGDLPGKKRKSKVLLGEDGLALAKAGAYTRPLLSST